MSDMVTTFGGSYADLANARPSGLTRLRTGIGAFIARVRNNARIRRDLAHLDGLEDRMLADIGLSRSGVESAVRYGRAR